MKFLLTTLRVVWRIVPVTLGLVAGAVVFLAGDMLDTFRMVFREVRDFLDDSV